ncbi:filaggrin [Stegastes partitus]|uniref:Filaggrin-like n=1 Tax=Stegastes partitus TaxID=144197 RepID=A0A3B5AQF6_9TELE|nr:PREDICTED: filaggrin-like [Stegastes partitus]
MLEGTNKSYAPQNEEENSHADTHACTSELTTSEKHSIPTVDQQVIDLSHCTQMPDEQLLDVSSVTDVESKERDEARHSEDAVKILHEQEIRLPQMPEMPQTDNTSGGVIDDATESTKIFSEASVDRAEIRDTNQSVLAVKSTDDATKDIVFEVSGQGNEADHVHDTEKPQLSDTERLNTAQADVYEIEGQEKDDLKAGTRKTGPQEAGLFSEMEDSESSSQSLQHELHAAFDSQPEQNNTSFNSGGNTSKLGSSQEKSMETMLEGTDKSDSPQIKDAVHVKQNEHFGPLAGISEFSSSSLHSSPAADGQLVESIPSERPDEGLPSVSSSVAENKESDENTELFRQDGRSWGNDLFSESHVEAENAEYPTTTEITAEESSSREHTEVESSVEQSPKKELAASGEQNENFNPFEVTGAKQSEDVVNKEHEELINPKQVQDLLQIDTEPQTLPSEINAPLDSQSQDNPQSIKDETLTAPNPIGSRRKLGSSRRHKGRQQAKEEAVENTRADEASETPSMSLASETARQEELTGLKSPEKIRNTSAVNDDEKLPEKDTSSTDSSAVVTADMSSRSDDDFLESNKDVDDKEEKPVKETENLSHLTGHDTVKMDLMQPTQASVWKDISHHDDSENARPSTVDTSAQEEASQLKNTEDAVGQDVDVQQTNDTIETVGAESSMDKQAKGEAAEKDSTNKVDALQEMNLSHELVSEPVGDVESGISTAMDAPKSQEEKTQSDQSKNLQVKSDQKRRKMGSTRRSQLNRKQEGEADNKGETTESEANARADVRNLDETQDVKELVLTAEVSQNEDAPTLLGAFYKKPKEGEESGSAHDEGHRPGSSSNVIPGRDGLMAPEPSASRSEEAVDPDGKDGERNVDVHVEPSSAETQITPVIAGRDRRSLDQLLPLNTETTAHTGTTGGSSALGVTTESTRNDDERPQSATQDQESKEQKPNTVIEEVQIPEMKNASPNLTPTSRRRKMGSTRRNLGSRTREEGSRQKQDEDNEATETEIIAGGIKTVPGIKETELQLHTEHKEGDPEHQRLLETVEHSQVGESQSAPPAQQTVEENPVSQGQLLETEQLTPSYLPSTSPKKDATSASGSRRRKMGSHRKSRGLQGYGDQTEEREGGLDAQKETDVGNIAEEGGVKASGEESAGLRRISEVDDKKPTSDVISKVGEPPRPASEKTPFQPPRAEAHLGREQFSLAGEPRAAGLKSASYHVVMIGDSSVGKTSFMKRAQTGKFSLDIPASIGLDSCMWTVVVDGKPVVLEIWDTAGQERFRSITRHVFHRAQAFLLMYDITCTESFSAVSYWANCIQESAAEDVTVLLLGNKSDCAKRQVQTEQGEILAKEYRFEFMECSAATGENVVQSLETVARMLNQRIGTTEEAAALQQQAAPRKTSTCC